jgi:DeoR/GlpR family transcriptional regulator of sugar metabolism
MIQGERRRSILEHVVNHGSISIPDICETFDVSEMTARRDLRALDREGLLRRVHGGALSSLGRSYEPPYNLRSSKNQEAKQAIGRKAAELIYDGDSIALDVGTTTLEVARALHDHNNLTIITTSLPIANEIASTFSLDRKIRLILTGGIVRQSELSMIGDLPVNFFQDFYVDKAFIGVGGLNKEAGLTEFNLEDAMVKKALLKSSKERIVVADSDKFGQIAFAKICYLASVDKIITDYAAPERLVNDFRSLGIEVILADRPGIN